jgi:hypothetical protein
MADKEHPSLESGSESESDSVDSASSGARKRSNYQLLVGLLAMEAMSPNHAAIPTAWLAGQ